MSDPIYEAQAYEIAKMARSISTLEAENAKLRERVAKLEELLPENGRWFHAETVEAYVDEIATLRDEERACGNDQCAKDHAQLDDWLRELREARLTIELLKILRDGFKEDARVYKAENSKLRGYLNELLMIGSFNGSCRRDCRYMDDCLADRFGQPDCFVCQELRELGIEVSK